MKESTRKFLEILEKQNASIAAREAEEKAAQEVIGPDLVRLRREEARREKYGQLRARDKPSKRPKRIHRIFGYSDLSSND